ncbi:MAG: hypothetical protein ACOC7U_05205 [Spirochaetota bacterium]
MQWVLVIDFTILSISLLIASFLRSRLRFLQRFLVPNAITAGFVGFALLSFLERVFPQIMPDREVLGNIVYHLLAVTFISIGLKKRERYLAKGSATTAFILTLGYVLEGLVGYSLTLFFMFTIYPDMFPTFGLLFPIGFGQSSGQAYALGKQWEALGFAGGSTIGLTFGAVGFLWACFVGIPFMNWGIKRGYMKDLDRKVLQNTGFFKPGEYRPCAGKATTHPDVIASGTFHMAFIGVVYLVDYLFIWAVVQILTGMGGEFAVQFSRVLWAYHAFFATLWALLLGKVLDLLNLHHILDDEMLTGISATSVDFLVTAAIMAIELVVVIQYLFPIALMCITGGVFIMFMLLFMARRSFEDHFFERTISIFGLLTGTVSTGLALLRVVDPKYRTPAASDLVLGSGFSLFIGFPLLFLMNLPALHQTVKIYLLTEAAIIGYAVILFTVMIATGLMGKKRTVH